MKLNLFVTFIFSVLLAVTSAQADLGDNLSNFFGFSTGVTVEFTGNDINDSHFESHQKEMTKIELKSELPIVTIRYQFTKNKEMHGHSYQEFKKKWPISKVINGRKARLYSIHVEDTRNRKRATLTRFKVQRNRTLQIQLPQLGSRYSFRKNFRKGEVKIVKEKIGKNNPYEYPFFHRKKAPHRAAFIERGDEALITRLHLIKTAKKSIDLEYFIFNITHRVTLYIVKELIKRAKEGIKVRLLLDDVPFGHNENPYLTALMQKAGIQIKIYNRSADANLYQYRNHRKTFIVDGNQFMIGGRNIDNAYFGLSNEYNFADYDLLVKGPLTQSVTDSFNRFWEYEDSLFAEPAKRPSTAHPVERVEYNAAIKKWKSRLADNHKAYKIINDALPQLEKRRKAMVWHSVNELAFTSDRPGARDVSRILKYYLLGIISNAKNEILMEAPFFIPTGKEKRMFEKKASEIPVTILTNSRQSVNKGYIPVAKVLELNAKSIIAKGATFYGFSGEIANHDEILVTDTTGLWEQHGKAMIVDEFSFVGTYNFDPRSRDYNAESYITIFDKNTSLKRTLRDSIMRRTKKSFLINKYGKYTGPLYDRLKSKIRPKGPYENLKVFLLRNFGKGLL